MSWLTDKVVVVTGASEGIGRALCEHLAPHGPRLVLAARNADRLSSLKRAVERAGASALVVSADLSEERHCRALIERTVARWGGVDVLVNNAGLGMWAPFEEVRDPGLFERLMRINYLTGVWCTYHALPHLRQARGRIVTVASVAGITGLPLHTGYCASKFATVGFFESLRIELKGTGVTVTIIAPEFVETQIHRRALGPRGRALNQELRGADGIMSPQTCAARMTRAIARRQRLVLLSLRSHLAYWSKPFLSRALDSVAARVIRSKDG